MICMTHRIVLTSLLSIKHLLLYVYLMTLCLILVPGNIELKETNTILITTYWYRSFKLTTTKITNCTKIVCWGGLCSMRANILRTDYTLVTQTESQVPLSCLIPRLISYLSLRCPPPHCPPSGLIRPLIWL